MALQVRRKNGIPIYIQIKEQIVEKIRTGEWEPGDQLPTERQLAEALGVSRNTVSTAYRELEAEGVLISRRGRGTFVAAGDKVFRREGRKERLLKVIDLAIEEAAELGFSIDEFIDITAARVREKKTLLSQVQVAFIECNREQLEFFSRQLHLGSGIAIIPVLLDDLLRNPEEVNGLLAKVDLVVTTFFHMEQVYHLLPESKKLVPVALEPDLNSIVQIARNFPARKALLVCLTENFAKTVRLYLSQIGIDTTYLSHSTTRDPEELARLLADADVVLVSPGRKKEVDALVGSGKEVIEFILRPDEGSVSRLKSAILELKNRT